MAGRRTSGRAPAPGGVLAVFAHPDDAELACGGTLAAAAAAGHEVWIVSVCQGDKGAATLRDSRALASRRAAEAEAAAEALGAVAWTCLGRVDGEVDNDADLRRELVALVRRLRPDRVVTGDPTAAFFGGHYVNHRDHREVGWAVLDAVAPAAANPNYFTDRGDAHSVAEVWLANSLEADHWVDVSAHLEAKVDAVACHESQLGVGGEVGVGVGDDRRQLVREMLVARAAAEGRGASMRAAESFRRLVIR